MRGWLAGVLLAVLAAALAGQGPEPSLRILAPPDGGYVSGDVLVRASVEPASQKVDRMVFFADERMACTLDHGPFECAWSAGREVREHTFRVVAYLPGGRRVSASVRTKGVEYTESVDVDMVQVVVSVLDGDKFVRGLTREAFRVFEDDVRQQPTYFASETSSLELVVGVDVSESMTEAIGGLKENVKRFLSALRPADRVTLTAFNENFFVLAPPAADLATRLKKVDYLAPWGMTSLYEVIVRSYDQLSTQPGRRALVIFSDGEDTSSRIPRDAVERRVERNEAKLYMIGQGKAVQSAELKALCERLAAKSGARAFFPKDMDGLRAAFDAIVEELSNQYLLAYPPPSSTRDGRWHRLRVEVDGGYTVRAPQGYRLKDR